MDHQPAILYLKKRKLTLQNLAAVTLTLHIVKAWLKRYLNPQAKSLLEKTKLRSQLLNLRKSELNFL